MTYSHTSALALIVLLLAPFQAGFAASCPNTVAVDRPAEAATDGDIQISADQSEMRESGETRLRGHVEIEHSGRVLNAGKVTYNQETDQVQASGAVVFAERDMVLEGSRLDYNLVSDQGTLENAYYSLKSRPGHGSAKKIIRQGKLQRLEQAVYTGCPAGEVAWELQAKSIDLDLDRQQGEARDVKLVFKDFPLFYTPYLSFPLSSARKSGLLVPSFGSSSNSGSEFAMPYYWNIAPNLDATLTPGLMGRRGATLEGEFRYLGRRMDGETSLAYLPDDNLSGADRKAFAWQHNGKIRDNWQYRTDFNYVSDDQYFEDFGGSLARSSVTHLQRKLETSYQGQSWWLDARVRGFQTLAGAKPYQELPRLRLGHEEELGNTGFEYGIAGEYAAFNHQDRVVTGNRIDLYPSLSYPIRKGHYFINPRVGLRYTSYDLTRQLPGLNDSPDRSAPVFSLDSGLFLERDVDLWGLGLVQTLEPRMFYLKVPARNQDDIPLFDTTAYDFSFPQLFRDNRFTGGDRLGDADQVTAALTTRMLNPRTGGELLQASVGHIQYFADREVQLLPGTVEDDATSSEIVTALAARISRGLTTRAEWQWDPHASNTTRHTLGLRYQPDEERILNVAYRQRRGTIEQTDVSLAWPVVENWRFVGRSNYSLRDNKSVENYAGLEYQSCCFAVRFLQRQYIHSLDGEVNRAFMVQLELKGLTSIGSSIDELLADNILGYDSGAD